MFCSLFYWIHLTVNLLYVLLDYLFCIMSCYHIIFEESKSAALSIRIVCVFQCFIRPASYVLKTPGSFAQRFIHINYDKKRIQ